MPTLSTAEPLWPQALARYPFSAALLPGWRERAAELPAGYQAALDAALTAFDPERTLDERYRHLTTSRDRLTVLAAEGDAHIATQLLRIRVHRACGELETLRQLIEALLKALDTSQAPPLDRPFLPALESFDQCPLNNPQDEVIQWLTAQALDAAAEVNITSRHAHPMQHLGRLVQRRKLPCISIESERMLALVALRLGKKVSIKPGGRLMTEGRNTAWWTQLGSESTRSDANHAQAPSRPSAVSRPLVLPKNEPIQDHAIFIVGCGHTGTTLMASILGTHPRIHTILRETQWFLDNPHLETEYALEKQQCLARGKTRILEKTPRHVYKIKEIKQRFPNAKFIAMKRNSKDVVASLKKRNDDFEGGLKRYIADNKALLRDLPNDVIFLVRYEDLITDQEATMREVLQFLDLDYTPTIFDYYKKDYNWFGIESPIETDGKEGGRHIQLRAWQMRQPLQDKRGSWKKLLSPQEAKRVEQVCDDLERSLDNLVSVGRNRPTAQRPAEPIKQATKARQRQTKPWQLDDPIRVVDIGANPIDGTPPYASLLKQGVIELVGFEPQRDALAKLQQMKGLHETYLPHAVGDGQPATLYICQASGMTSTFKPNTAVLEHFQGYPFWGKVKHTETIDTVRLDDVPEISHIDWLKIDIQGGELAVCKHGVAKLKDALVIQTEANFIQLYEGQPLFADIDQWMRSHGFMLHALLEQRQRLYAPMKRKDGIHQGINQLTTADAVYIRHINQVSELSVNQLKKLAVILHNAYGSYDLSLRLMNRLGIEFSQSDYLNRIGEQLPVELCSTAKKNSTQLATEQTRPGPPSPAIPQSQHVQGKPIVSVICLTYNHVEYIEDAIRGFIGQKTDFPFEVIIHDDASTDGTQEVIKRYAADYPELIRPVFQKRNQMTLGKSPFLPVYRQAQGRYVALCDGDDYWVDPLKLQLQCDYMQSHADCSITHHNAFIFDNAGIIEHSKLSSSQQRSYTKNELIMHQCFVLTVSMMFRKVTPNLPKEMKLVSNGDSLIVSLMGVYGYSHYFPSIKPAAYRVHSESVWSGKSQGKRYEMLGNTSHWIGQFHKRHGRQYVAECFQRAATEYAEKAEAYKKTQSLPTDMSHSSRHPS